MAEIRQDHPLVAEDEASKGVHIAFRRPFDEPPIVHGPGFFLFHLIIHFDALKVPEK